MVLQNTANKVMLQEGRSAMNNVSMMQPVLKGNGILIC